MKLTITNVNKALAAAGIAAELVKGKGYFWFSGDEASDWYTSSVGVPRLDSLRMETTVADWVAQYETMRADHAAK